jgi:hypothetical protein
MCKLLTTDIPSIPGTFIGIGIGEVIPKGVSLSIASMNCHLAQSDTFDRN